LTEKRAAVLVNSKFAAISQWFSCLGVRVSFFIKANRRLVQLWLLAFKKILIFVDTKTVFK